MKLGEWFSAIGQSSHEIEFARSVYLIMLTYHLSLIDSEAEKMAKAKAQIAETGKTKMSWDEEVAQKNYAWSIDVMSAENKFNRPEVVEAFNYLEANGFVKRLLFSGRPSQCFWIPLRDVLGRGRF